MREIYFRDKLNGNYYYYMSMKRWFIVNGTFVALLKCSDDVKDSTFEQKNVCVCVNSSQLFSLFISWLMQWKWQSWYRDFLISNRKKVLYAQLSVSHIYVIKISKLFFFLIKWYLLKLFWLYTFLPCIELPQLTFHTYHIYSSR